MARYAGRAIRNASSPGRGIRSHGSRYRGGCDGSGGTRHGLDRASSVVIKGELDGSEDLTIEGHVEGKIELRDHTLTIGPNGRIKAQVFAKAVIVLGELVGNINASEKVDIRDNGSVDGDIVAPRVAIAEGAHFRGSIDMQRKGQAPANPAAGAARASGPTSARLPPVPPRRLPNRSSDGGARHVGRRRRPTRSQPVGSPGSAGPHARNPSTGSGARRLPRRRCGGSSARMQGQPSPVLLDLGPVSGTNVSFLGERLGCKLHLEDLFADID